MRKAGAVFLDRDGVINRERGQHTWKREDLEVLPGVGKGISALRDLGYKVIVITNQSGIGLGLYGHKDVEELHRYIHSMLSAEGAVIDDMFYCPHHPSFGKCLCRKPGSLLIERAIGKHQVDVSRSVMIGDRDRDVEAAERVGMRGMLVRANSSLIDTLKEAELIRC